MISYSALCDQVSETGLVVRGGFYPKKEGQLPTETTLILIGHVGRSLADFFSRTHEGPDPLDRWCHGVITELAQRWHGRALFPDDGPPFLPFQAWARRADPVFPSPLGLLIHPEYGLWHGYRGALLLPGQLRLPEKKRVTNPCDSCLEKPCLNTCPVNAFSSEGFQAMDCASHLKAVAGSACRKQGCLARRACPLGQDHIYEDVQQAFHMNAFLEGPWFSRD